VALHLATAARDAGVRTGIVADKLFLPGLRKLKRLLDGGFFRPGALGAWRVRLLGLRGDWQEAQRPSWNYRVEDGGGVTLDMFCHWDYVMHNLFGA